MNCIWKKLPSTITSVAILTYIVDVWFTKVSCGLKILRIFLLQLKWFHFCYIIRSKGEIVPVAVVLLYLDGFFSHNVEQKCPVTAEPFEEVKLSPRPQND